MILVTSGGTYRVGSHHSFPEESVRIKRDDKKAKRCCLVIHWCLNSHYSALEEFHCTWATFIKPGFFVFITIWPAYNVIRFFWFQIAIQMNKYQLDKCCPICPHVAKTNRLTDIKIHAKGGRPTKCYKTSRNHRTILPFPFTIIPFPFFECT